MNLSQAKLHFVGIGGVGMSGIAELFKAIGAKVTGSDIAENANTQYLASIGVQVFIGHKAENLGEADVLVYSSAVTQANPELVEAKRRRVPVIPRAEALAELMRLKRGIAVAGSHGKTTTTSMTSQIFLSANQMPTVVIGGRLRSINSGAHFGDGDWLIAEADESDGSFSRLSPEIAVITNIDNDHLDFFKSFDNLLNAFYQFGLRVPFYGAVFVCGDDPHLKKLFEHFPKKIFFYGFEENNDYRIIPKGGRYQLLFKEDSLGVFDVPLKGRHNVLNAAVSLIVGLRAGISFEDAARGLMQFSGVERRLHLLGTVEGVDIYTDYAHHPTELRASISAFREMFPERRLVGIFQPHRYSRTELCWNDFLTCFQGLDQTIVTDVYAAGERPIGDISGKTLAAAVGKDHVRYASASDLLESVNKTLRSGDVAIYFGAGDIYKTAKEALPHLSIRSNESAP